MIPALTPKQAAVMTFIRDFHAQEDRLPSTRDIQAFFGFASQTGALCHLRSLCRKGYLEHRQGETKQRCWWRFARLDSSKAGVNTTSCTNLP